MKRAVFWVAWGEQCINEAHASATTVKRHMPDVDRVLWLRKKDVEKGYGGSIFDRILKATFHKRLKHAHWMLRGLRFRVDAIHQLADYDRLLFLDTDTHLCAPVHDLFDMLDRFDFVTALSTGRRTRKHGPRMPNAPFPERNSGVVAFKNDDRVRTFHDTWLELYLTHRYKFQNSNQRSLREAIWGDRTGLQFGVIPTEWNCRFAGGFWARLPIKILHGRSGVGLSHGEVERIVNPKEVPMMRAWAWESL